MSSLKKIACVTGSTGMVGRRIVKRLCELGYHVRALSRTKQHAEPEVKIFVGDLANEHVLDSFLTNAQLLFHCAAELHDTSKMYAVNVSGTERLAHLAGKHKIQYLCHISSAGVVGKSMDKWIDESSDCNPQNEYERSKWEAERVVSKGGPGCRVLILRPTNIVDELQLGELTILKEVTLHSRLKMFVAGGECAHIIHADNVAAAATHFIDKSLDSPECFFVSSDNEIATSFVELYELHKQLSHKNEDKPFRKPTHLPIIAPYLLRKLIRQTGNLGDVKYSSNKLLATGFQFPLNIRSTLQQLFDPCR